MSKNPRFWRNLTLIAFAHLTLVVALIHWSLAARGAPDAESLVWLSGSEDLEPSRLGSSAASPPRISAPTVESEALKPDEAENDQQSLAQAKSEIELATPTSTPKPSPSTPPKPKATSKPTPKPTSKPTRKKTVLAKASKSSPHAKPSLSKSKEEETDSRIEKKKSAKITSAKTKSSSDGGAEKIGAAGKGGSYADGESSASEFTWYANMLHDRFYSAWIQPTSTVVS